MRRLTLYRDDSTAQVIYDDVKTLFWTANNTVLTVARFVGAGPEHFYVHWPRERFCWFRDDPGQVVRIQVCTPDKTAVQP